MGLYSAYARMQGQTFGVHFDLLQIFLCVQLQRSADWQFSESFYPFKELFRAAERQDNMKRSLLCTK